MKRVVSVLVSVLLIVSVISSAHFPLVSAWGPQAHAGVGDAIMAQEPDVSPYLCAWPFASGTVMADMYMADLGIPYDTTHTRTFATNMYDQAEGWEKSWALGWLAHIASDEQWGKYIRIDDVPDFVTPNGLTEGYFKFVNDATSVLDGNLVPIISLYYPSLMQKVDGSLGTAAIQGSGIAINLGLTLEYLIITSLSDLLFIQKEAGQDSLDPYWRLANEYYTYYYSNSAAQAALAIANAIGQNEVTLYGSFGDNDNGLFGADHVPIVLGPSAQPGWDAVSYTISYESTGCGGGVSSDRWYSSDRTDPRIYVEYWYNGFGGINIYWSVTMKRETVEQESPFGVPDKIRDAMDNVSALVDNMSYVIDEPLLSESNVTAEQIDAREMELAGEMAQEAWSWPESGLNVSYPPQPIVNSTIVNSYSSGDTITPYIVNPDLFVSLMANHIIDEKKLSKTMELLEIKKTCPTIVPTIPILPNGTILNSLDALEMNITSAEHFNFKFAIAKCLVQIAEKYCNEARDRLSGTEPTSYDFEWASDSIDSASLFLEKAYGVEEALEKLYEPFSEIDEYIRGLPEFESHGGQYYLNLTDAALQEASSLMALNYTLSEGPMGRVTFQDTLDAITACGILEQEESITNLIQTANSTLQLAQAEEKNYQDRKQAWTESETVLISPMSATINTYQSLTFTSTVTGGYTPYGYQWYLGSAPVLGATSNTWTFVPTSGGVYYVYLKVTGSNATLVQSDPAHVEVVPLPVGGYSIQIQVPARVEPVLVYPALIACLAITFIRRTHTLRQNKKRKLQE